MLQRPAANRRTAVLDPLGQPTYYTYDAAGRPLQEIDAQGHEATVTYDAAGQVIGSSQGDQHLYYAYDATGNRSRLTFQGGGVTYFTYYSYDARNQLQSLTSPLGETVYYQYDALGREIARWLPNTVTTYHNYDAASQVTSLIHRGSSSVLQSLYYSYDADGQRTKIEREDNTRLYYSYDAAHRLTGEDWLDPGNTHLYAFAYNYDAAGNRTKQTCNTATTYYQYNNLNELTTESVLGGAATYYTWTADGAMATKHDTAGWTYYTWDVDESLKTIQTPTVTLENKYNSRMQRVWRSENGMAEKLIYDAQKLIAEATSTGTALSRYYLSEGGSVYSPLLAQLGSEHWFLADALGTTLGLTSPTGSLTDTFKYEAFGTSLGRTGTTVTPYQYVGGYGYFNEPGVGLEQVWWRWLSSRDGAWVSKDPVSTLLYHHTYRLQKPVSTNDPSGRQEEGLWPIIWPPGSGVEDIHRSCSFSPAHPPDALCEPSGCSQCCNAIAASFPNVIAVIHGYGPTNPIPDGTLLLCQVDCERRCNKYPSGRAALAQYIFCVGMEEFLEEIYDLIFGGLGRLLV